MDLLNQIQRQPLDPDYALVAARAPGPKKRGRARWVVVLVTIIAGILVASSAIQTSRRAPALATEREELITRIQAAEQQQDTTRRRANDLTAEITRLRTAAIGTDSEALNRQARIAELEPVVGTVATVGPGMVITVDDAASSDADRRDQVLDLDLQMLANGLWQAGAEAIAINGHRLSALTAIRGAGDAITVDYRSLTHPYRVEAIGDPQTLPARFAESSGGAWWHELTQNRGMQFETAAADRLLLPADPGMVLRYAKAGPG